MHSDWHKGQLNGFFEYVQDDEDDEECENDDFRYDLYIDFEKYGKDLIQKYAHYIEFANGRVADVNIPHYGFPC